MLASALYQLIDGVFVGQILGETALCGAESGHAFRDHQLLPGGSDRRGLRGAHLHRPGRREDRTANNTFTCACILIVSASAAMGAVLFLAAPLLMSLWGRRGRLRILLYSISAFTPVLPDDHHYFCGGQLPAHLREGAQELLLNIFMSVLSGVLEFLFLAVFHWGIWGAALATCSGMFVQCPGGLLPLFPGTDAPALLPSPLPLGDDPQDCGQRARPTSSTTSPGASPPS